MEEKVAHICGCKDFLDEYEKCMVCWLKDGLSLKKLLLWNNAISEPKEYYLRLSSWQVTSVNSLLHSSQGMELAGNGRQPNASSGFTVLALSQ